MRILILEDNEGRRQAMRETLSGKFPSFAIEFFSSAQPMIDRFKEAGFYDVAMVSLDHDLEMIQTSEGTALDPGTGVDVADWLATQPAVFPVVVHTTNSVGGERMMDLLVHAGWTTSRTVPYDGETWIAEKWYPLVRQNVVTHGPRMSMAALGLHLLKSLWQSDSPIERILEEALRAACCLITGSCVSDSFSIQLLFLDSANRLMPLIPEKGLFTLAVGNLRELVEEVGEIEPTTVSDPKLADHRSSLDRLGVRSLQIMILRFNAPERMQAVMIVSAKSEQFPLESHKVQTILAELRILLEVALLAEYQKFMSMSKKESRSLKRKSS
jgi:CheY-like chemotaxis protein